MIRIGLWTGALAIALAAAFAAWFYNDMQNYLDLAITPSRYEAIFTIKPGQSLRSVTNALTRRKIINRPLYFRIEARRQGIGSRIKAGEYVINAGTTPRALLLKFVQGRVKQYSITFVEGLALRDYRDLLAQNPVLDHTLAGVEEASLARQLAIERPRLEGLFFPDTYFFRRGTVDIDILRRAYERLRTVLQEEWQQRDEGLPYMSPYEALIMASIVEKETGLASERPMIAGVFVRRLLANMKLQADPTVIYGLGEDYDGNLRRIDLQTDTAFNTYLHNGLPPTPIAMPGRAAIRAVLHPATGDALYFVAKGDGSHHFSDTLDEHNRAVARYQLTRQ